MLIRCRRPGRGHAGANYFSDSSVPGVARRIPRRTNRGRAGHRARMTGRGRRGLRTRCRDRRGSCRPPPGGHCREGHLRAVSGTRTRPRRHTEPRAGPGRRAAAGRGRPALPVGHRSTRPLVPLGAAGPRRRGVRPARLARDDASLEALLGRLLAETAGLYEEEVPRSGFRVERGRQFRRWEDGSAHAWTTRRKVSGTGAGRAGCGSMC